ncbi:MAG: hypothetical protein RQ862_11160 [Candidatus Caldarchaeales archaeon]|jgi:predicted  nucleic acid-binding Zn-ribbon protein|nr:hypothetical protein [Candidatus Caldarchaeales archaeon]
MSASFDLDGEGAIVLRKFEILSSLLNPLLSFFFQKLEVGDIERAQQALEAITTFAELAQQWLSVLETPERQEKFPELQGLNLSEKLKNIRQRAKEWQEVLNDVWGNRERLREISEALETESEEFWNTIVPTIENLEKEKDLEQDTRKAFFQLKIKLNELATSLRLARLWINWIIEVVGAGKGADSKKMSVLFGRA